MAQNFLDSIYGSIYKNFDTWCVTYVDYNSTKVQPPK